MSETAVRLTGEEVLAAEGALAQLASVTLRADAAAHVARLARTITGAATDIRGRRDELVDRYAQRDAEGDLVPAEDPELRARGMVRIRPDRRTEFERELREMLSESVEVAARPIGIEDLRRHDGSSAELPASVLLSLGPLFRDS